MKVLRAYSMSSLCRQHSPNVISVILFATQLYFLSL